MSSGGLFAWRRAIGVASVTGLLVLGTVAEAADGVLTRRGVNETRAVVGRKDGRRYMAWTQSPGKHFNRTKVLGRAGGDTFRVNTKGTRAMTGGIDGSLVIYQQIRNGQSNLMGFNLRSKERFPFAGLNTRRWEMSPTISGPWILFGRDLGGRMTLLLHNRNTDKTRKLVDTNTRRNRSVTPGQVNGKWVAYQRCNSTRCSVFRYNIKTRDKTRIPHRRALQYEPAVSRTGTVFFGASGYGCGAKVQLLKRRKGRTSVVARLHSKDTWQVFAGPITDGRAEVLFAKVRCNRPGGRLADRPRANVYRVRAR